jgi:hypothetical protein
MALELYKNEFGEYPPDMLDDEDLVRHVKKRWPRLNWANLETLPIANVDQFGYDPRGVLTGVEREAWLIRNAVSIAYGPVRYGNSGQFCNVDFNDRHKDIHMFLPELWFSRPTGALALWLGGFPNTDGKMSGFYADPENPFIPTNAFDGKAFLDLEMGNNKSVRMSICEVYDVRTRDNVNGVWMPSELRGPLYTYAVPVLGIEVGGTFSSVTYFKGRPGGGDNAYRVNGHIKITQGPYSRSLDSWGAPYAESRSGTGLRWYNPTTYQLIHPGLDGKLGNIPHPGATERVITTGQGISTADLDNITNISDFKELRSILP